MAGIKVPRLRLDFSPGRPLPQIAAGPGLGCQGSESEDKRRCSECFLMDDIPTHLDIN